MVLLIVDGLVSKQLGQLAVLSRKPLLVPIATIFFISNIASFRQTYLLADRVRHSRTSEVIWFRVFVRSADVEVRLTVTHVTPLLLLGLLCLLQLTCYAADFATIIGPLLD